MPFRNEETEGKTNLEEIILLKNIVIIAFIRAVLYVMFKLAGILKMCNSIARGKNSRNSIQFYVVD